MLFCMLLQCRDCLPFRGARNLDLAELCNRVALLPHNGVCIGLGLENRLLCNRDRRG